MQEYRYTVSDVEHPDDYMRFATAIIDGGGKIEFIKKPDEDEDIAYIYFQCEPDKLENVKQKIKEQL